ncbi:uncharacterized protein LOC130520478 isoform X2 [Takifugu flavidus]|uniref:Uncharacterized protein n=1 Tax=Takifugu flavidus TaxID=433684 RepID=A0A5C6MF26_9TELE|nr:uncharacterized protein LOC130520268 isoform X2 [Takifugu flavidus]XP_056880158.1 uncharacterized protein LOC130520478 isoform X2 [Takifugu flavidus]TWW53796.1 hypothetical protein D4764_0170160 [Takifugu flavidus]TWW54404.1 hypothetical protein D4764_0154800 [Takifugu flavidus]
MQSRGEDAALLEDTGWTLDLAFLTDITGKRNSLNWELQGKAAAEKAKRPGKQSRPASAHKSVRRTTPSSTARSPSDPHIEVPVAAPERTTAVMDAAPQPWWPTATSEAQPKVTYEGWHKMWESAPNGLPQADVAWLKEDETNELFQRAASFQDKHGKMKWRKVLKDDRRWFQPVVSDILSKQQKVIISRT